MLFNELPTVFPWYEKIEQQNRYVETVNAACDFKLITPKNGLLPFQFTKSATGAVPVKWEIFKVDSLQKVADLTTSIPQLNTRTRRGLDYFYYGGAPLQNLNLPYGYFYSQIVFSDEVFKFSEVFFVPDKAFNAEDDGQIPYLKLTWYNKSDIAPIFYADLIDDLPRFKNVLYIDSFITQSEPEITVDGTKDGAGQLIKTFQVVVIRYRITLLVPDYLKKALVVMQMHDFVFLQTAGGIRSGQLEDVSVESAPDANGAISQVDIIFTDNIAMVKKGCAENMI